MQNDPLLQPYQLKHLTLRNRIMITAHEPAYAEDGMPKERYRAYHAERAKARRRADDDGGVGGGIARQSARLQQYPRLQGRGRALDEGADGRMPRARRRGDDPAHPSRPPHALGQGRMAARRLPLASKREAAHRAFPKKIEDWDIDRIIADYADAAERMKAADVDGIELEAYGHLMDQFWSPLTNDLDAPYGGSLDNRLSFTLRSARAPSATRVGPDFIVGVRYIGRRSRWKAA